MSDVGAPEGYSEHAETVMSNYDHEINHEVAAELKDKPLFAQYSGWNFCGYVWWDRKAEMWACEVWHFNSPAQILRESTLEELMSEVCAEWGYE